MLQKRDMQLVRLGVRRKWLTPEEGEDLLFLKRKFGDKYTIEEIIRRRQYLEDDAIAELTKAAEKLVRRRGATGIFRRRPPPPPRRRPMTGRATMPPPGSSPVAPRRASTQSDLQVPDDTGLGAGAIPEMASPGPELSDKTSIVAMEDLRPELRAFLEQRQAGLQKSASAAVPEPVVTEPEPEPVVDEPQTLLAGQAVDSGFLDLPIGGDRTVVDPNILSALQALRAKESQEQAPEEPEDLTPVQPEPYSPGLSIPSESTSIGIVSEPVRPSRDRTGRRPIPKSSRPVPTAPSRALRDRRGSTDASPTAPPVEPTPPPIPISPVQPTPPAVPTPPPLPAQPQGRTAWDQSTAPDGQNESTLLAEALDEPTPVAPVALDPLEQPIAPDEEIKPGQIFGPYTIDRLIARGGMGIVYLATPADGTPQVALKVLKASVAHAPEFVTRFFRESEAAAKITSPHVVEILDVGAVGSRSYLTMEYIDGWTLTERFESGEPPGLLEALRIMRDVARGLQAAAEQGVVHRDVKPDNIMIDRDGRVLLTDFGLAKEVQGAAGSITDSGAMIVGTPNYMSPEQAVGKRIDHRADLYSLGATMFHVLAGRPVYSGASSVSIIAKHISRDVPDLKHLVPSVPPAVADIVLRLLAKFPDDRFSSAGELADEVQRVLDALGSTAQDAASSVATPVSVKAVLKAGAPMWGGAIALAVVLPFVFDLVGLVEIGHPASLLGSALTGVVCTTTALLLLVALGLVRRGELPLPGSTAWVVTFKDSACALGAAALVAGIVLGPPAILNVTVAGLGVAVLGSAIYGVLLRRAVAASRPDGGVGRVLAVLGDHHMHVWRRYHGPLLTTLVVMSATRWALLAYFRATGLQ